MGALSVLFLLLNPNAIQDLLTHIHTRLHAYIHEHYSIHVQARCKFMFFPENHVKKKKEMLRIELSEVFVQIDKQLQEEL